MTNETKLLLIVDVRGWAFESVARVIAETPSKRKFEIVYTSDYGSYDAFCAWLTTQDVGHVHFFWRAYLHEILNHLPAFGKDLRNKTMALFRKAAVTMSVPDHLYLTADAIFEHATMFDIVDGIVAVNGTLAGFYENLLSDGRPVRTIHDTNLDILATAARAPSFDTAARDGKFVWVGNSKWGEWQGCHDYKGLEAIFRPAVALVEGAESLIIDSAVAKVPRSHVLEEMRPGRIFVCTSEAEGTPLPLLEAMARGMAVVTTDVGLARETLPASQQRFILVRRDAESLAAACRELAADPELVLALGRDNYAVAASWRASRKVEEWDAFFREARLSAMKREDAKRSFLIRASTAPKPSRLSRLRPFVRQYKPLKKLVEPIYARNREFFDSRLNGHYRYSAQAIGARYRAALCVGSGDVLAIHTPKWRGVSASTQNAFAACLPVPWSASMEPNELRRDEIEEIARAICGSRFGKVVISGGDAVHLTICEHIKRLKPSMRIALLWHGSQALWSYAYEREMFCKWMAAYDRGVIDGFLMLKPGMAEWLQNLGYRAWNFRNSLSERPRRSTAARDTGAPQLGLWAAADSWIKNIHTQYLAASSLPNATLWTAGQFGGVDDLPRLKSVTVNVISRSAIERRELLRYMGDMDLNLYVTFTECQPMIPLESIWNGRPCLCGPAVDYFDDHPQLKKLLVVERPDSVASVYERLQEAIRAPDDVLTELHDWAVAYKTKAASINARALDEIFGEGSAQPQAPVTPSGTPSVVVGAGGVVA